MILIRSINYFCPIKIKEQINWHECYSRLRKKKNCGLLWDRFVWKKIQNDDFFSWLKNHIFPKLHFLLDFNSLYCITDLKQYMYLYHISWLLTLFVVSSIIDSVFRNNYIDRHSGKISTFDAHSLWKIPNYQLKSIA